MSQFFSPSPCGNLPGQDYNNLCQCESLEDVKLNLQETDYDQFLASDTKVTPALLQDKATRKLVSPGRRVMGPGERGGLPSSVCA